MKKILVVMALAIMANTSVFAQFMNTTPTPSPTVPKNVTVSEKSPAVAGLLSFLLPGIGQFYNGESSKGWGDLGTQIGCALVAGVGSAVAAGSSSDGGVYTGLALSGVAGIVGLINGISSIVDAVKSAKRINMENGYAFIEMNNGMKIGLSPDLTYTHLASNCGMQTTYSPGMKLSVSF